MQQMGASGALQSLKRSPRTNRTTHHIASRSSLGDLLKRALELERNCSEQQVKRTRVGRWPTMKLVVSDHSANSDGDVPRVTDVGSSVELGGLQGVVATERELVDTSGLCANYYSACRVVEQGLSGES